MNLVEELKKIERREGTLPHNSLYHKFLIIKKHFIEREDIIKILFPLYTLHNHKHSDKIIEILSSFNHKKLLKKPLNKYEIFLLISAAYLHDIGMIVIIKEQDINNKKINIDNVRDQHHIRSFEYILEKKDELKLDEFEALNLALICKGHRKENLYDETYYDSITCPDEQKTIRIDLLSALLRIADGLDISYKRVESEIEEILDSFLSFDIRSKLHWYKHYYTINYSTNFIVNSTTQIKLSIEITFHLPDKTYNQRFIIPFVIHPIKKEINYVQQIFQRYGFSMKIQETSKIRINEKLKKIPEKLYDALFTYLLSTMNIKVLIIDDDELIRDDFSYIINDMGFAGDTAKDSKTAWEKIQNNSYHLILLDLKIPDFDQRLKYDAGLDLLKRIKMIDTYNIVIIISVLEQTELIINCFKYKASDYIVKDKSQEEIKNRIRESLKKNFYKIL